MDAQVKNPIPDESADRSVGELFHQLVDDGTNLFRAELNLYRQTAFVRVAKAKGAVAAIVAGALITNAAITVALVGLAMGLADLIGPVAAGLVVAAATALVGYLLIRSGIRKVAALSQVADRKETETLAERVL